MLPNIHTDLYLFRFENISFLQAKYSPSFDEGQIKELLDARIPIHSRWESNEEFKEKISRRDELIPRLQEVSKLLTFHIK